MNLRRQLPGLAVTTLLIFTISAQQGPIRADSAADAPQSTGGTELTPLKNGQKEAELKSGKDEQALQAGSSTEPKVREEQQLGVVAKSKSTADTGLEGKGGKALKPLRAGQKQVKFKPAARRQSLAVASDSARRPRPAKLQKRAGKARPK